MTDYALECPDGETIEGTYERMSGTALIAEVIVTEDGWTYEHEGSTEVDWDTETTVTEDGEEVFVCADGRTHKKSELRLVADKEDDE